MVIHKRLTTPTDPSKAVLEGIQTLLALSGIPIGEIASISHGTTLVTNALIERRGALSSAICVQLVEDDELEVVGVRDDLGIDAVLTGQKQFRHHEVGKKYIWWIVCDALPRLLTLLARVAPDDGREAFRQARLTDELLDFLDLTVSERVHGINDDRARSGCLARFASANDGVDDRDEETERLSRSGPGRHNETVTGLCFGNCLSLVPVKPDGIGTEPEDLGGFRAKVAGVDEIVDCRPLFVVRVQRKQRVRPKAALIVLTRYLVSQIVGPDLAEGSGETRVVIDDTAIELEGPHAAARGKEGDALHPLDSTDVDHPTR